MLLERLNLKCDKCGVVSDFEHKSAAALHEEGERRGWAYDAHGNYCPDCAVKRGAGGEIGKSK